MPNIREYEAPQGLGLNPTETGIDALTQGARRIGTFGQQIASTYDQEGSEAKGAVANVGQVAVSYINQKDRSDVSVAATGALAKLDQSWNVTTKGNGLDPSDSNYIPPANPNDPTVASKFMEEQVEPVLQKLRDVPIGEAGQEFAQNQIDQIRSHLSQKLTADLSTMAGEAEILKDRKTTNNLSNLVTTSPDFHSVDMALSMHKDAAAGWTSNPNITGDQLGKMNEHFQASQEQIVHAAAAAAITQARDPQAVAAAFIKRYPDYIKGDEANALAKAAQTQSKVDFLQNKAIEAYQDKQKERAASADLSKNFGDNVKFNADGTVSIDPKMLDNAMAVVRKYPGAADESVRAQIAFAQGQLLKTKQEQREIVTDPASQSDLLARMNDPKSPTSETQILTAANQNKLDAHATSNLLALRKSLDDAPIKDPVFNSTFGAAKAVIEQSLDGQENFGKFAFNFMTAYRAASNAGTLKSGDLDMNNPDSLISKEMAQFKPSIEDRARYHMFKTYGSVPTDIDFGKVVAGQKAPPPTVTTKAQFDGLKSGDTYIGSDGKTYRKP